MSLRRFWLVFTATALGILALFAVAELTGFTHALTLPEPSQDSRALVAGAGVLLLWVDVLLPVPSSVVMLAHGAWFGVVVGTALSLLGAAGATLLAVLLGRSGSRLFERLISAAELSRASALFERYGVVAIALTRPIPVLAETVAIVAGASRFSALRATVAGALGALPAASLYAWAGSRGFSAASDAAIFALVLGISAVLWLFGRSKTSR